MSASVALTPNRRLAITRVSASEDECCGRGGRRDLRLPRPLVAGVTALSFVAIGVLWRKPGSGATSVRSPRRRWLLDSARQLVVGVGAVGAMVAQGILAAYLGARCGGGFGIV